VRLDELASRLRDGAADLGFATDGDGDRIAVLSGQGEFVQLHDIVPLLVEHLVTQRGMTGRVVRSVALHDTLDRLASDLGIAVAETPVGFRHLCEQMVAGGVMLAAEESGGIGFDVHIPERDGIVSALMILDMIAAAGGTLDDMVADLRRRYGPLSYRRIDRREAAPVGKWRLRDVFDRRPWEDDDPVATRSVWIDGIKLFFEAGGWLLVRVSETEAVTRFYAASRDAQSTDRILRKGTAWVDSVLAR
jgi:phosphomannomutase